MNTSLTGLLCSAVLLTSISNLYAAEQDAVIVTATRTAQTMDESLASVTVLTEADIQRSQANNLQDLLQSYAGMQFTNNGGPGKTTGLFMRGTSPTHVLIMIDGIKTGSATSGATAIQNIPVSQIERIEIVRGPRSSLYGSEAIGGVIQIFTKKGSHTTSQANIQAGYGTYNTSQLSAGFSGGNTSSRYNVQASSQKTDGIDVKNDGETDSDGYKNNSINANYDLNISETTNVAINMLHAEGSNDYDGSYTNESDFVQQAVGLTLDTSPTRNWKMLVRTGYSTDESDNFLNGAFKTRYNTKIQQTSLQNDFTIGTHNIFTLGVDYKKDEVASTTNYDEKSRDNTGVFMQHQWSGENNDLVLGVRSDDNQAFGTHTTGNIGWGYKISNKYRLTASYGTGFSAPSFNQLYYPGYGVATLKPEESETYELGIKSKYTWGQWDIHAYRTNIDNMIGGAPLSNVDKAEINGLELRLSGTLAGLQHQLNLSYTDPRDAMTDKILRRRSRQALRYDVDQTSGNINYGISLIAQGEQYEDEQNTKRVSGYGLLDLRASYVISKQLSLKAKINNVFDQSYETIDTYNQPGLNAFASINYQGF